MTTESEPAVMQDKPRTARHQEEARRGASPADTLISDFQPPNIETACFSGLKPPSLCHVVTAALGIQGLISTAPFQSTILLPYFYNLYLVYYILKIISFHLPVFVFCSMSPLSCFNTVLLP